MQKSPLMGFDDEGRSVQLRKATLLENLQLVAFIPVFYALAIFLLIAPVAIGVGEELKKLFTGKPILT